MAGYTPLFDSLTTGTLCGKWPDIGLWPIILSLCDRAGHVDVTPAYLAGITGLPVAEITACMERFCAPDPGSRSREENGARLRLIDPDRAWGWVVVNKEKYREKARLMSRDAQRTESGYDAERKRRARVPRSPPKSPVLPLSESETKTDTKSESEKNISVASLPARIPEFDDIRALYPRRAGSQPWPKALKACNARLHDGATWIEMLEGVRRYQAFCGATGKSGTEYVMQAATFFGPDRRYLESWDPPANKAEVIRDTNIDISREWLNANQ